MTWTGFLRVRRGRTCLQRCARKPGVPQNCPYSSECEKVRLLENSTSGESLGLRSGGKEKGSSIQDQHSVCVCSERERQQTERDRESCLLPFPKVQV